MVFDFQSYGCYPKEYNRAIHGPYDPSKFYGPADTPFDKVKLADLPAWLGRRSLNPRKWLQAGSRWLWRYHMRWTQPKNAGAAAIYQFSLITTAIFYVGNYPRYQPHRHFKYH